MTVKELVAALIALNQDAEVFIYTDDGCRKPVEIDNTIEGIVDLQWREEV
jgi:hypothetical protein